MPAVTRFAWDRISDEQFEELVYAVLSARAPTEIRWRKGPGDKGRDVEASFARLGALGESVKEKYFVEAKHHKGGVSPVDVAGALAWAAAEVPDVLLLALSGHLTTPCHEHINSWAGNNPRTRVIVWERPQLENHILGHASARSLAVAQGLVPPSIAELLPTDPQQLRSGASGLELEMEYRYWIGDEETEKLDAVVNFIQMLSTALETAGEEHFELTAIGAANWSSFLKLFQAQLRLEIAVRDYLVAATSDAGREDMERLAAAVQARVAIVRDVGDASFHVD